jgi:hypothetical protein
VSQDMLRLRKTPLADSMEAAEIALSDIVKQALDQAIAPEQIVPAELLDDSIPRLAVLSPDELMNASDGTQAEEIRPLTPSSWTKGQLLNVRNRGEFYVVTLLGEEDDPPLKPAPNGALRFTNTALCQDFVSKWYATEHHDPRAR